MFFAGLLLGIGIGFVLGYLFGCVVWDIIKPGKKRANKNTPIFAEGRYSWNHTYYCSRCKVPVIEVNHHSNRKYSYIETCPKCDLKFDWSLYGIEWEYTENIYSKDREESENCDMGL